MGGNGFSKHQRLKPSHVRVSHWGKSKGSGEAHRVIHARCVHVYGCYVYSGALHMYKGSGGGGGRSYKVVTGRLQLTVAEMLRCGALNCKEVH